MPDPTARGQAASIIFGGTIGSLTAGDSQLDTSTIAVYGSGFNYPLCEIPDSAGTLTGTLFSGDPIDADFQVIGGSSIVIVPEPRSLTMLLVGCGVCAASFHLCRWRGSSRRTLPSLAKLA